MKKSLLALAAMGAFAGAAHAQSSVSVYGIIDTGYLSTETKSSAATPITAKTSTLGNDGAMSGSRLGFRGTEDLGGGMRANFNIEMGITTTDTGMVANASNRNSFVGLSDSKLGEIRLGRFATLNKLINDSTVFGGASFNGTNGGATSGWGWAAQANGAGVSNERINNALHYISPTFSGANIQLQLVDDVNDATTADAPKTMVKGYFVGANYATGNVAVRYARKEVKSEVAAVAATAINTNILLFDPVFGLISTFAAGQVTGVAAVEETKVTQDSILASYNFGVANVVATYNNTTSSPLTAANETKRSDLTIGASVPLGKTTLLAQYSQGTQKAVGTQDDKLTGLQLGAVYNFSKRSNIYAAYGTGKNKDGATDREGTDTVMALGVRHTF